jgi:hypothetical protein
MLWWEKAKGQLGSTDGPRRLRRVRLVKAFLEANGVPYLTAVTMKTLLPTVIAARAGQFATVVECWR